MSRRTVACQGVLECPRLQAMNITNIGRFGYNGSLFIQVDSYFFKEKNYLIKACMTCTSDQKRFISYIFLGNLNAPIQFRYNLNSISWFCILTIYFNTLVICIMINIFFPAESPPAPTLAIYGTHGTTIE